MTMGSAHAWTVKVHLSEMFNNEKYLSVMQCDLSLKAGRAGPPSESLSDSSSLRRPRSIVNSIIGMAFLLRAIAL